MRDIVRQQRPVLASRQRVGDHVEQVARGCPVHPAAWAGGWDQIGNRGPLTVGQISCAGGGSTYRTVHDDTPWIRTLAAPASSLARSEFSEPV